MKRIELIYTRLNCGGIGYAPELYRLDNKYYTVRGDIDAEGLRHLGEMDIERPKKSNYFLWRRHQHDNEITATEFLKLLEVE